MTPDEFVRLEADDVSAWWKLSNGEAQNLFEAAMEERDRLRQDQTDWRKGVALIASALGETYPPDLCCSRIADVALNLRASLENFRTALKNSQGVVLEEMNASSRYIKERDQFRELLLSFATFSDKDGTHTNPCWCSVREWLRDKPHGYRCRQIRTALGMDGKNA